jgi:aspartate beta-hydroxylase
MIGAAPNRDPWRESALERLVHQARTEYASLLATSDGQRVGGFLRVLAGEAEPDAVPANRRVHRRMFMPGLTARPYWPVDTFAVTAVLRRRFGLMRQEAASMLAAPHVFYAPPGDARVGNGKVDGGRLIGTWNAWYLQRYFKRQSLTAAHTPVTLRSLDTCSISREALFSMVGPGTHITLHSDELNFVTTLYLPLIATRGAWIDFAGEPREWREGDCFAADTTFLHESINATPLWRAILIVDVWHPELAESEVRFLTTIMPLADAIMRGVPRALLA